MTELELLPSKAIICNLVFAEVLQKALGGVTIEEFMQQLRTVVVIECLSVAQIPKMLLSTSTSTRVLGTRLSAFAAAVRKTSDLVLKIGASSMWATGPQPEGGMGWLRR
jgi:hypothetical protein